ncbi:MAG: 2-oxo acid dehydrogenase subunit E2 [Chloroflexi bacterium]|nr:2-oxo acid dehydrogenase subunit E2 [Chloroflexota bacterium]
MSDEFQTLPYPPSRRIVNDAGRIAAGRPLIHGLVEFDVTQPRAQIRDYKERTGDSLSFTAYLVTCLAKAIAQHPIVGAHLDWRSRLIVFHDVDVVVLIEPERGATAFPHILRAVNQKTVRAVHDEIRAVQAAPRTSRQESGRLARLGPYAPRFLRLLFYRLMMANPHWLKRVAGTVVLTSVGMFARGGGWGIGYAPMHPMAITVGGIAEKPGVVNGQIVPREFLDLTITVDHRIIDGAPAARFAQTFKELVESGALLNEAVPP